MVQDVLAELGRLIGLGALPLNAEGRLTLTFDSALEVTLEHEPEDERLVLWALLGELGVDRSPALLNELLDANFLWHATGGATLAVEQASGRVVIAQALSLAGLTAVTLERAIEGFVNAATHWGRRIAGGPSGPSTVTEITYQPHHLRA